MSTENIKGKLGQNIEQNQQAVKQQVRAKNEIIEEAETLMSSSSQS